MTSPEPTGDVVEAILGLCQLCTEHYSMGSLPMKFLSITAAYSIWTYMESSIAQYVKYSQQDP